MKLLKKIDGWKSILSYIGINLSSGSFLPIEAISEAVANPTANSIFNAVVHVGLALGLTHRAIKNVK
jgi:hypothetical protein